MLMTQTRVFDTAFLKKATGGAVVGTPAGERVVTDSREELEGAVFVAIVGPRFDGHDYVEDVLAAGAGGAVVSSAWWESSSRSTTGVLVVPETVSALQSLARAHRDRRPVDLVGVTGTNGKTGTKDLLAAALAPLGPVHKTRGNYNNHIGVPLTLLGLSSDHRAAVVEMGINHPGEMRLLAGLARPRVGVITNVAAAHLEGLGSVEGVARAKAEMAEALPPDGVMVTPHGSAPLDAALAAFPGRRVTFGTSPGADLHPRRVEDRGLRGVIIELPDGTRIESPLVGAHAVLNLLAALAAAEAMGVDRSAAAAGLAGVSTGPGRLRPRRAGGVIVLDDTYNANPASLAASLSVLRAADANRIWAILGDMLELGPDSARLHRECGCELGSLEGLVTVGALAREIGHGAVAAGLDADRVREAEDGTAAADLLAGDLAPGDAVLVKGSRGMRLETAVERLLAALGGED